MKKIIIVTLVIFQTMLPCVALAQDNQNVDYRQIEMNAEHDAKNDLEVNKVGWGLGAFGASILLSPLLGGGATIVAAYSMGGDVTIPSGRIGELNQKYPNNYTAVNAYENKYVNTYKSLKKKGQGKAAWAGTGAGFVVMLLLISSIVAE